jgi:hypothetical protein
MRWFSWAQGEWRIQTLDVGSRFCRISQGYAKHLHARTARPAFIRQSKLSSCSLDMAVWRDFSFSGGGFLADLWPFSGILGSVFPISCISRVEIPSQPGLCMQATEFRLSLWQPEAACRCGGWADWPDEEGLAPALLRSHTSRSASFIYGHRWTLLGLYEEHAFFWIGS